MNAYNYQTESPARVASALAILDPSDRNLWVRMAMAVKAALGDDGFDIWDTWSKNADNYSEASAREVWRSAKSGGGIGSGTLFFEAKAAGWRDDGSFQSSAPLTAEQIAERKEREVKAAAELAGKRAAAAKLARELRDAGSEDTTGHAYARLKGTHLPFGAGVRRGKFPQRSWDDALLVPIFGPDQKMMSLEAISPDGEKIGLKDGARTGGFYPCAQFMAEDTNPSRIVIVAEGLATAAACQHATGYPAVAAFSIGNLRGAAESVRKMAPDVRIVIAADLGAEKQARTVAVALGACLAVPAGIKAANGDFWNVADELGSKVAKDQIEAALLAGPQIKTDETSAPAPDIQEPAADDMKVPEYMSEVPLQLSVGQEDAGDSDLHKLAEKAVRIPIVMPIGADARDGVAGTFPLTEVGNCYRMLEAHGQNIRFVPELNTWLHWSGGRWLWDTDGSKLRGKVRELATSVYVEGSNQFEAAHLFLKWARVSQAVKTIKNVASLLEDVTELRLPLSMIDGDSMIVGLDRARKVLDLRAGECREACREDYVTRSLGVSELGDASKAYGWGKFINEIFMGDTELINWVKRYIGYTLTGCYNEQIFVFAHGGGSNGKSVLIKVMKQLSGEYARTVASTTLMEQKRGASDASPDVAALAGARLLLASETSAGSVFDEEFLKGWTGGDTQSARHLYRDSFSFEPVGKLFIAGNYRPRISGTDHAIWCRVRLLPFMRTFCDEEKDSALPEKLADELPHILAWAMEGCLDWRRDGLNALPRVMKDAGRQYEAEQDILGEFLAEATIEGPIHQCTSQELFDAYKAWMLGCNLKPISRQALGRQLGERGFKSKRNNKGAIYQGLMLVSPCN